jgi:hypothetical protein
MFCRLVGNDRGKEAGTNKKKIIGHKIYFELQVFQMTSEIILKGVYN